jgi:hypothetical protein
MSDPRRHIVDAALEALRHTVGRDQHMPHFLELVQHQVGPITYAEIADALEAADLKGGPGWQEEWADLIATLRRAAARSRSDSLRLATVGRA